MIHFQATTTLLAAALLLLGPLGAQRDPEQLERLRRDQDEILRKAERLQVLMDRLRQRYEREGRKEQVELLQQGLVHLEQTGVLREVASIRDDLAATAFTEALRKQREVVDDLERLLNILLERKAIENIEEEAKAAAEQARTARELEQRQKQLIEDREAATRREPAPGEKELLSALQQLRDAERTEAEANARDAGSRRPFLESALERVRALQQQQQRLDEALAAERSGQADASRAREFDLGELTQATRELQRDLRRQGRQEELGAAARELQQQATGSDQAGRQRARDALQGKLEDAPPRREGLAGSERDQDWRQLREQLAKVPTDDSAAPQLAAIGAAAAELAAQRTAEQKGENTAASKQLAAKAGQLAQTLAEGEAKATPPGKDSPSGKVGEAAKSLAEAQAATERGDRNAAQEQVNAALRALDEARAEFRQQNPDAAQRAGQMAAEAAAVAQELRSAPTPEQAEQQAAAATAAASAALRQAEAAIEQGGPRSSREPAKAGQSSPPQAGQNPPKAGEPSAGQQNPGQPSSGQPNSGQPNSGQANSGQPKPGDANSGQPNSGQPNSGQPQANPQQAAAAAAEDPAAASATAKAQLAAAEKALAEALASANAGGESQQQAAAERQQQLAEQAAAAAQQMAQAAQQGQITPQQQQAAQQQLAKAQQQMQQATQQLQQGQQASASRSQQDAAQALQQAMDAMQKERPLDPQQQQQLKDQAKAQQQLAEDIIRLAEELKKRGNKAAEQAAQQAADAARKAQRALDEGDEDEAGEQQEQARQQLEKAAEELDEEQDRYQDMRQEELQFRMREELKAFLEAQRPISQQTTELQKTMPPEGLSRAARRKCNQLGEEEQALGNKLEPLLKALVEEDSRVYLTVLQANLEDLREISRRLSGRAPDLGNFTTLLQADLERRTVDLLAALEREKKRREQERQQQQQQDSKNKFNPQQRKIVSLIAELEMLKRLGQDTARATSDLQALVETRDDSNLSATEAQMTERLSHRHDGITKLFQQIKAGVEKMLQQPEDEEATGPGGGR